MIAGADLLLDLAELLILLVLLRVRNYSPTRKRQNKNPPTKRAKKPNDDQTTNH